jgi:hypothetical protein
MWTLPVSPAGRLKDQTFRTSRSIVSSEIYGLTLKLLTALGSAEPLVSTRTRPILLRRLTGDCCPVHMWVTLDDVAISNLCGECWHEMVQSSFIKTTHETRGRYAEKQGVVLE